VIASAALRPEACNVDINCCHAAPEEVMVMGWSEAENTSRTVKDSSDRVNREHGRASNAAEAGKASA
jgi:hypothetical protein